MDAEYAREYRRLYEQHWWWRARETLILGHLRRYLPRRPAGPVLDVGCGDALSFGTLAEFGEVEGVEIDGAVIDPSGRHASRIHVGPFDDSFQPSRRYALITMLDVLEHLTSPRQALEHALGLLRDTGIILITVPAFLQLWTSHDALNHHLTRYTRRTFADLARVAGLEILEAKYFFHWLCLAKLAVKAKERLLKTESASVRIPSGTWNRLLYRICRMEQQAIGWAPVPFGSSLLVVGRPSSRTGNTA
jgi:2-polyprenyl-3-methyl-5-hydroxy-6-metoxy-1,4-benzoquinol methylase